MSSRRSIDQWRYHNLRSPPFNGILKTSPRGSGPAKSSRSKSCQLLYADTDILSCMDCTPAKFRIDPCRKNVHINEDRTFGRIFHSFIRGGSVVLDEFLKVHEFVEIQVNKICDNYNGHFILGLTTLATSSLSDIKTSDLCHNPPDSYIFSDEYFYNSSDTIIVWLLCTGEVQAKIGKCDETKTLCNLNLSNKYKLFVHMTGTIFEIRAFIHNKDNEFLGGYNCNSDEESFSEDENSLVGKKKGTAQKCVRRDDKPEKYCVVCFEGEITTAVYKCGHKCLCFDCGTNLFNSSDGRCPICRAIILDVIRIYEV